MARMPPVMSVTTQAAPSVSSVMPGTWRSRACSTTSWSFRSTVSITLSPGRGACSSPVSESTCQLSEMIFPFSLSSTSFTPAVPRRMSSKASSAPSLPTMAFMA